MRKEYNPCDAMETGTRLGFTFCLVVIYTYILPLSSQFRRSSTSSAAYNSSGHQALWKVQVNGFFENVSIHP